MDISERVASRFISAQGDVWLPGLLGVKEKVITAVLRELKAIAGQSGFRDIKGLAGGVCYYILKESGSKGAQAAEKLWKLLDRNAGLSAGDNTYRIAQDALRHLSHDREVRLVQAAAAGISLLQRTRQMTKAAYANSLLCKFLDNEIAKYQAEAATKEPEKAITPTERLAQHVEVSKAMAAKVAKVIGKDPALAAQLAYLVCEDANAREGESAVMEAAGGLITDKAKEFFYSGTRSVEPSQIAGFFQWGIVEVSAFGIALLAECGVVSEAKRMFSLILKAYAQFLDPYAL